MASDPGPDPPPPPPADRPRGAAEPPAGRPDTGSRVLALYPKIVLSVLGFVAIAITLAGIALWAVHREVSELRAADSAQQRVLSACANLDRAMARRLEAFFRPGAAVTPERVAEVVAEAEARLDELEAAAPPAYRDAAAGVRRAWGPFRAALSDYAAAPPEKRREIYDGRMTAAGVVMSEALAAVRAQALEEVRSLVAAGAAREGRVRIALVALLAVAVAGAAAALIGIRLTVVRPLRKIGAAVARLEAGQYTGLDLPGTGDEFGRLGAALGRMAAALAEYRAADERAVFRARRLTQTAIDSLPHAIALLTPDGRVELANHAAAALFGLAPGASVQDLPAHWLADMTRHVRAHPARLEPQGYESAVQVFDASGERIFLPHVAPILDEGGALSGMTVVLVDATQLRRIDEAKSSLISTVSHELKTPLTSIQMCIHLALDDPALTGKPRELVRTAAGDADRLGRLIESLLDMGRLQAGRAQLHLEPVAVADLVDEALGPLKPALAAGALTLERAIPPGLPPASADRARIRHAFENLFSNAAKYTPAGGRVAVSADATPTHVRVRVSDTGVGIPADYLPQIFEKFVRVPRDADGPGNAPGAGLGLTIAREIVHAHGGEIHAESTPGRGATFTLTLPRADLGA